MRNNGFKISGEEAMVKYQGVGKMVRLQVDEKILYKVLQFLHQVKLEQYSNEQAITALNQEDLEQQKRKEYVDARKNIINYSMGKFHKYSKQNRQCETVRYLDHCLVNRQSKRFIIKDLIELYQNNQYQKIQNSWTDFLRNNLKIIIQNDHLLKRNNNLYQQFIFDLLQEPQKPEPYKGFYRGYNFRNILVSQDLNFVEHSTHEEQPQEYDESYSKPQLGSLKKTRIQ